MFHFNYIKCDFENIVININEFFKITFESFYY